MKKSKKFLLLSGASALIMVAPIISTSCSANAHDALISKLQSGENPNGEWVNINYSQTPYKYYHVYLHNHDYKDYLVESHTKGDLDELEDKLIHEQITPFEGTKYPNPKKEAGEPSELAFIPAAETEAEGAESYSSIWVRDSVWNILALKQIGETNDAIEASKSLFKYFRTDNQKWRMENVITNPNLLKQENGAMIGVHIRFDANTLEDVQENGKDQYWSHKQNDALGLFISLLVDFALDYIDDETIWPTAVKDADMQTLARLVSYLNTIDFWIMEDSGAWEEIEKISCSSIACVVSAFSKVVEAYNNNTSFKTAYDAARESIAPMFSNNDMDAINKGITNAYEFTLEKSIEEGGESILYPKSDESYREADTAMLNLIYPYGLPNFHTTESKAYGEWDFNTYQRIKILQAVEANNNDYGMLRYKNDNYQCSDFWFANIPTDVSEESYKKREELFIDGSEASWFFDSWMAICYAKVAEEALTTTDPNVIKEYHIPWLINRLNYHINKAIAFINKSKAYRSDGTMTEDPSLPESYTVVTKDGTDDMTNWYRLASPIDPLRWSQSSLSLMIKELMKCDSSIIPDIPLA